MRFGVKFRVRERGKTAIAFTRVTGLVNFPRYAVDAARLGERRIERISSGYYLRMFNDGVFFDTQTRRNGNMLCAQGVEAALLRVEFDNVYYAHAVPRIVSDNIAGTWNAQLLSGLSFPSFFPSFFREEGRSINIKSDYTVGHDSVLERGVKKKRTSRSI